MRRQAENVVSVGLGSQLAFQGVAVISELWPEVFERAPTLEAFLITVFSVAIAVPASWGFSIYGKRAAGNGLTAESTKDAE